MPVDLKVLGDDGEGRGVAVSELTRRLVDQADGLGEDLGRVLDQYADRLILPLIAHRPPPALRGVARLRVEADAPARRWVYAQRMELVERAGKVVGL